MQKYKYLLWDVDGTVLDFLAAENAAIKALFLKYNFGECTDEMIQRYSRINRKYWEALERGELSRPEVLVGRFREFFTSEGLDADKASDFNQDYQLALGDTIVFCDDAFHILTDLKGAYQQIAITNGTKAAQDKKLRLAGLLDVFDHIFISEEVGYEKPNPAFFQEVFRVSGIEDGKDALVIGDSLTSDIKGGNNAGIHTCWYNPSEKENDTDSEVTYEIKDLHQIYDILK